MRLVAVILVLLGVLLLARLFFLQVVRGEYYSDQVDRQYLSPSVSAFDRGSIYFTERNGQLSAAASVKTGYLLYINPKILTSPEKVYQQINALFPLDRADFLKHADRPTDTYEEIAHQLPLAIGEQIKALKIKGVSLSKEKWRFYPAGRLASHVIGLLAFKGDERIGRYGLEKKYNTLLQRETDISFVNYFASIFLDLGRQLWRQERAEQGDIILTIEPLAQNYLEKQLADLAHRYRPASGGGIIMDPQTGAIAAMAALPNFNPGEKQASLVPLANPLIERTYEMGSVMKPLTLAAAMNEGLIKPETTFFDTGTVTLNNKTIRNHDDKAFGQVSMQKVLDDSINTGAIFAEQKLGQIKFKNYFLNYGIREKTGIDLPDEIKGLSGNLDSRREVEFATAAFGQGISWTPIGLTRAWATLGNGGFIVTPHVVKSIRYSNLTTAETEYEPVRRVLTATTSRQMSEMLTNTFDRAMVGGKYRIPHYRLAAKTGTAQMARPGGGYYTDRYLHSFLGYFPASRPRFIIFLYLVDPQGVPYASESLAEPFSNLARFLINYYEIAPDR